MLLPAADSFGSYGRRARLSPLQRVSRAADWLVTAAIALALVFAAGLASYSLWDTHQVSRSADAVADSGLSFGELLALNPDVVAWLTIDNTNIDFPVCQGEDDFEYLTKNALGEDSASGSIFLDAACDPGLGEPYEMLMGHHMADSKMFGDLDKFLDEGFFDANSSGRIKLPDRTLELEVCAILSVDAYDRLIYNVPVTSQDDVAAIVGHVRELATFCREGSLSADDQVIALSTCSSDGGNVRTVLVCRVTDIKYENNAG